MSSKDNPYGWLLDSQVRDSPLPVSGQVLSSPAKLPTGFDPLEVWYKSEASTPSKVQGAENLPVCDPPPPLANMSEIPPPVPADRVLLTLAAPAEQPMPLAVDTTGLVDLSVSRPIDPPGAGSDDPPVSASPRSVDPPGDIPLIDPLPAPVDPQVTESADPLSDPSSEPADLPLPATPADTDASPSADPTVTEDEARVELSDYSGDDRKTMSPSPSPPHAARPQSPVPVPPPAESRVTRSRSKVSMIASTRQKTGVQKSKKASTSQKGKKAAIPVPIRCQGPVEHELPVLPSLTDKIIQHFKSIPWQAKTKKPLQECCETFGFPQDSGIRLPSTEDDLPPPGYATIYGDQVRSGTFFPLHPFFVSVLRQLGVALSQCQPNTIRHVVRTYVVF